jgi:uncharacterized protein YciI
MFRPAFAIGATALCLALSSHARTPAEAAQPTYDAELARSLGADDNGMKSYVFVLLKTGPNKVPAGTERDEMFKGHFANMKRLGAEGKLALAGPLDGAEVADAGERRAREDREEALLSAVATRPNALDALTA